MKAQIPKECKNCTRLWTHGIKDDKHNKWCCAHGGPAYKMIGHCRNTNYSEASFKDNK